MINWLALNDTMMLDAAFTRRKLIAVSLLALSVLVGWYVSENPITRGWEEFVLDNFFSVRDLKAPAQNQDAVLIIVDEESIRSEFGYFDPIPRRYLARLIDSVSVYQPRLIVLDIALMHRFALDMQGDSLLAASMARSGRAIGISLVPGHADVPVPPVIPDSLFRTGMMAVGHAMLQTYRGSGVFARTRSLVPLLPAGDSLQIPALSLLAYQNFQSQKQDGISPFTDVAESIPLYREGMLINFWGPPARWITRPGGELTQEQPGSIPTFRSSLITGPAHLPDELLREKAVFIGSGSEYSSDQFLTPYYGMFHDYRLMRGAEVHANAFLTLLYQRFIQVLPTGWFLLVIAVLAAGVILAVLKLPLLQRVGLLLLLPVALWIISFALFVYAYIWLPVFSISAAIIFSYAAASIYHSLAESYERKKAKIISHYWLRKEIGSGGMGTVYLADDLNSQSKVAVKVLNPALWDDAENRGRFANEGRILAEIDHPGVVKVLEAGETPRGGFIAMEYLPGPTLKTYIRKHHPTKMAEVVEMAVQIAEGLAAIHARQIVHRDLSSSNIMFGADGRLRIMDFGLSKSPLVSAMTVQGSIVGTLGYAAPEQITGVKVDQRCDLFSLGVVLYEMVTGQMPFQGENEMAIIHALFNHIPAAPGTLREEVSRELEQIILSCLEKSVEKRCGDAQVLAEQLNGLRLAHSRRSSNKISKS